MSVQGPPTAWSTPTQFSQDLLAALGIPANDINVGYLNAWQGAEGQWGASGKYNARSQNNPLNTTQPAPGAVGLVDSVTGGACSGAHPCVQSYPDPITGLNATLQTLSAARYRPIVQILAAAGSTGNTAAPHSPGDFATAVGSSGWGTNPNGILAQWNKGDPGAVYSGGGLLGTATLGALGSGATGPATCDPVWKVGPYTILNTCQARHLEGAALIVAGGGIMLVGTIVLLFRFAGTRHLAEAAAAVPVAGNVARLAAGRAPVRRPSSGSPGPASSGTGSGSPSSSPPKLTAQDLEDLNTEMAAKRQKAEGQSEGARNFANESRRRRAATGPAR